MFDEDSWEGNMLQTATKPLAQPTAMSLGESQATHVHTVEGGLAVKTEEWTLSNSHGLLVRAYTPFSIL